MKMLDNVKLGLMVLLLAGLMTGCSSAGKKDDGAATVADDSVSTGSVGDERVYSGVADLAAKADIVFYFEFDKAELKPEAQAALRIHAETLRSKPRPIVLEGHADERGTREYNMALGERRGNAVKEFLVLQGVDGSYLEVVSYGEEKPAALGSDEGSWSLNRRVEMK